MHPYALLISPEFGYGGVGIHTLKIANFLSEAKYRVRVHTTSRGKKAVSSQLINPQSNPRVDSIGDPVPGFNLFNPLFDLFSVFKQGEKPNVILRPFPVFYLRLPYVSHGRVPELIIVHDTLLDFLSTVNSLTYHEKELSEKLLSSRLGTFMLRSEKTFLREAEKIVAVSYHTKRILSDYYGITQERIRVIYNPVNTTLFKRRSKVEIESEIGKKIKAFKGDSLLAVFVGRPYGLKNLGLLATLVEESYKQIDLKFVVVGISETDSYARNYIEKMKRLDVFFAGYVDNNLMPDVYSLAEFIVITSFNENLPTCLLEAMACGTIPISTNVGGISEMVKDRENGFLVGNNDEESFLSILNELSNCDSGTLDSISKNAQETATNKCERELVKKSYLKAIKEII